MAFTKITNTELNSRGCTTLPNQPMISAQALKQEFDAPAKEIVAPKFNNLIDELEATTAAASIGAVAPTGRTGNTVQALLNDISEDIGEAVADAHTHDNKALLDTYDQTNEDLADAVTKKHSHSNKDLLDTYTQSNSDLADSVSKKHDHSNKALLDTYTQSDTDIADAVSKKHSHVNKATLDLLHTYYQNDVDLTEASFTVGYRYANSEFGTASVGEGYSVIASGDYSHAEGRSTKAEGNYSHAEGSDSKALANYSHAEGSATKATNSAAHAEGEVTEASGIVSHAEGTSTKAIGRGSHAEGNTTIAGYNYQHVSGRYNNNKSDTLFEIGKGLSSSARANAFEVYFGGEFSQDDGATKFKFTSNNGVKGYYDENGNFNGFGGDVSGKADKVSGATSGNFAGLDSNGNLTDSGKKASDFLTSTDLASYYTKNEVDAVTGDLTDLTTTAKNNLVAAINEAAASGGGGLSDAFQKVKSGVTTLTASGADTLELKAGSNVTLTPDASDNSITISASGGGQSTGDMLAADYDPSYNVKNAGGIPSYVSNAISGKADSSSLATVATSGSYNDLSNKPTIPAAQVNSDWNASSGVAQILNKPTIPDVSGKADKVSGATSGNFASLDANGNLTDSGSKASDFKAANAHDAWSDVTSKPFSSVNSGIFDVVNDELRTTQGMVTGIYRSSDDGSASSSGYRAVGFWYLDNTGSLAAYKANVFEVMKQTATATSYTFTNTPTNTNKMIDVYSSIYGEVPTSVTTPTDTSVTVTFAESKSRTVAITLI